MNKFVYSLSLLSVTAAIFVAEGINLRSFATEANTESVEQVVSEVNIPVATGQSVQTQIIAKSISETETVKENEQTVPGTVSHQAADLLVQRPVDPVQFCKDYPYNSACQKSSNESQPQTEVSQPKESQTPTETAQPTEQEPEKTGSGWAITPEVSTLGLGASVTKSITPNLNARVGLNAFSVSTGDIKETDVTYKGDLNLFNISTLVDYHPWKESGFRLSGGLVFNDNRVEANGRLSDVPVTIGNQTYVASQIGSVKAKISFPNSPAPYLGIGWGNAVRPGQRWGFSANLGVMFAGSPQVSLTAENVSPLVDQNLLNSNIAAEKSKLENDLSWLNIYPVLSLGVSYQF